MSKGLSECRSDQDRVSWLTTHLKEGGFVSDLFLWLAGINDPIKLMADAELSLRAENMTVCDATLEINDAAGRPHRAVIWRVQQERIE